jgi:hypothetical protein
MNNQNSTDKPNKTTAKDLDQAAIAGIQKYLASVPKVTLAGVDYTPVTLVGALQTEVDALTALDGAKAQWKQQVADAQKVRVKTRSLRAVLRSYILTTFGQEAIKMLGDFGMKVPKNLGARSAEAKAKAAEKALATRRAKAAALKNAEQALAVQRAAAVVGTTPAKS